MIKNKNDRFYLIILLFVAFLSITSVSTMGFLNYKSAVTGMEENVIKRLESETVKGLQTSISFGKQFDNYYGIDTIFENFDSQIAGTRSFIIDTDGSLMYCSDGALDSVQELLKSKEYIREFSGFSKDNGGSVKKGEQHGVFYPIHQNEEVIGYYGCIFNEKALNPSFAKIFKSILIATVITMLLTWVCLAIFIEVSELSMMDIEMKKARKFWEKIIPLVIMAAAILILSAVSLYYYQEDYRAKMKYSVGISLKNLQNDINKVQSQGVDIRTVDGLRSYIGERVSSIDVLYAVRISEHISEFVKEEEESNLIRFRFTTDESTGGNIYLEAELSDSVMRKELNNITFVLLSTMIILLIFAFELNNLVDMLKAGFLERENSISDHTFSEKQMSLSLRFTGFLCATAEYMCVPYAAMMIRESGQSLSGLSVGVTAALPLTLEQFTLMVSMFVMPGIVKKTDIKKVLVFSSVLMIACNVMSFLSGEALTIIICRGIAGVAYCGFKQVSNHLIAKGHTTEEGRSENISQDNAGLLAGMTCGAGLGAILSANSGYAATFFFSAVVFVIYLLVTFFLVPWKKLNSVHAKDEESKPIKAKSVAKMFLSPEMLYYILIIAIPLNIGVMLCVTLIPAICQTHNISSIMLSYCYIANGLAGIYLGPALVSAARRVFGLHPSIAFAFALTAFGIFILHLPPVVIMIVLTSMILGFLDGFGTPLVTDRFMSLGVVRHAVDEPTALVFNMVLTFVLLTFVPMIAELMILPGKGFATPMMAGAIGYAAAAVILMVFRLKEND